MSAQPVRVDYARLRYFLATAFETAGMPPEDARTVATLMAEADLQGSDGHGSIRLRQHRRGWTACRRINAKTQMPILRAVTGCCCGITFWLLASRFFYCHRESRRDYAILPSA